MRSFIAIELPAEIKDFLSALQLRLKSSKADVKWVKPQNAHLTLKFLGEIDQRQLEKIIALLDKTSKSRRQFDAGISSLGAFPKIDFPKVIWAGLGKGDSEIKQIAEIISKDCIKIGVPEEKRGFSSHITLGRVRPGSKTNQLSEGLKALIADPPAWPPEFPVERIALFKSTLTPQGPVYQAVHRTNLTSI